MLTPLGSGQVDKEKAKNLPVSGFMDVRDDVSLAKLQVGFVKFVVQPFYEKVGKAAAPSVCSHTACSCAASTEMCR